VCGELLIAAENQQFATHSSIRRECLDQVLVFREADLRRILKGLRFVL
jgi:hypothetical protein